MKENEMTPHREEGVARNALLAYLDAELQTDRCRDYCPNGLQVEGKQHIRTLVTGVTASLALLECARDLQADAVLVHHGYFWRGEDPRIVGIKHGRLRLLLAHEINLLAYHLPLDQHPEWGNNAQLARQIGLVPEGRFGENELGWWGQAAAGLHSLDALIERLAGRLGRAPLCVGPRDAPLTRIAWCTGAAQGMLAEAIAAGATVFLSGEISEPTVHLAREAGVAYLACGHHATERFGVQALGDHLAERFGVRHHFIDIANPV